MLQQPSPRGRFLALVVCAAMTLGSEGRSQSSPEPTPDEAITVGKRSSVYSEILGETRPLEIYLPPFYDEEPDQAYPLLVVLDGGTGFQYMVSILSMIAPNHLPEMVVVGIPNTNRRRDLDVLGGESGALPEGPQRFMSFLEEELFPHLEEEYRVLPQRVLAGHSLAGLFSLQCLFTRPELFQGYLATSPSLGDPRREAILMAAVESVDSKSCVGKSLFFSIGSVENAGAKAACERLTRVLGDRQELGLRLTSERYEGEGHVPMKGFYQGLREIFANWIPPRGLIVEGSLDALLGHYSELSVQAGFEVRPAYDVLGAVAGRLRRGGHLPDAIAAYTALSELYPYVPSARETLVTLQAEQADLDAERAICRESLASDPDDQQAWEHLASLGFPVLRGPYLGQTLPGLVPQPFAPFLLPPDCNKHSTLSFTEDGLELYLSVYTGGSTRQRILTLREEDGVWTPPHAPSFGTEFEEGAPLLMTDGQGLYFGSKRPSEPGIDAREDYDIWLVERQDGAQWNQPQCLGDEVNSSASEVPISQAQDGGLYFGRLQNRRMGLMYTGSGATGSEPARHIKDLAWGDEFFQAVDVGQQDFFLFDVNRRVAERYYLSGLYISYRQDDGSWSVPKSMGDMINRGEGRFPSLSADGQLLFFTSYRTGSAQHYWVDAAVIDYLRTNDLDLVDQLVSLVQMEGLEDDGMRKLRARYERLRLSHAKYYTFDGLLLGDVAARLTEAGRDASAVQDLNRELNPE